MALRQYRRLQVLARGWLQSCSTSPSPICVSSAAAAASDGSAPLFAPVMEPAAWFQGHKSVVRAFHSPGSPLDLPTRRGFFADLPVVSNMLSNKLLMAQTAQFSPHGLTLVPSAIITQQSSTHDTQASPLASASLTANTAASVQEPAHPQQQAPMLLNSIKTWRRLKMKKHKIRKRRKAARMQSKK